jgi:hypothetical protein
VAHLDDSDPEDADVFAEAQEFEEAEGDDRISWDSAWGADPVSEGGPADAVSQPTSSSCSLICPRCGLAEESSFHQLWECKANEAVAGARLEYLPEAREQYQTAPCFWLRGLPPIGWTYPHCMRAVSGQPHFQECGPHQPVQVEPDMVLATDGSGGPHSADPRVRRCGWGFVALGPEGEVRFSASGPLDYWKQTVPLAELAAVTAIVLCTVGDLTVVIDNQSIVQGVQAGPTRKHDTNCHAWRVFWALVGDRRVQAVEVKSLLTRRRRRRLGCLGSIGGEASSPTSWPSRPPWRPSSRLRTWRRSAGQTPGPRRCRSTF